MTRMKQNISDINEFPSLLASKFVKNLTDICKAKEFNDRLVIGRRRHEFDVRHPNFLYKGIRSNDVLVRNECWWELFILIFMRLDTRYIQSSYDPELDIEEYTDKIMVCLDFTVKVFSSILKKYNDDGLNLGYGEKAFWNYCDTTIRHQIYDHWDKLNAGKRKHFDTLLSEKIGEDDEDTLSDAISDPESEDEIYIYADKEDERILGRKLESLIMEDDNISRFSKSCIFHAVYLYIPGKKVPYNKIAKALNKSYQLVRKEYDDDIKHVLDNPVVGEIQELWLNYY